MKKIASLLLVVALGAPAVARAEEYDPQRSGHPLRIAAYALHPAGWLLDTLIFHPAWWIGGFEPIRTIVGRAPELNEELREGPRSDDGSDTP